jgi:hypothetical protein
MGDNSLVHYSPLHFDLLHSLRFPQSTRIIKEKRSNPSLTSVVNPGLTRTECSMVLNVIKEGGKTIVGKKTRLIKNKSERLREI